MANLKDIGYGIGKYLTVSDASNIPGIGNNRKNIDLLNFKVAVNNAYTLYNFKDGMIDAYQTEDGVDATTSTNETYDASAKYYSGTGVADTFAAFTSTGASTWTCPTGVTEVEVLVVGGGGGSRSTTSANIYSGGSGAGGIVHDTDYTVVPAVVYDITVGTGGAAETSWEGGQQTNGADSVWNVNAEGSGLAFTAKGGGYGATGGGNAAESGSSGGSGGGGATNGNGAGSSNQAAFAGATSYGNAGGSTGGGGGAGEAGNTDGAGTGGTGVLFSTFIAYGTDSSNVASTGSNGGWFGGGGTRGNTAQGSPYAGGGGAGSAGATADAGLANTGGGAGGNFTGGGQPTRPGAVGGSGVVLLNYDLPTYNNMTLISNAQIAQASPDEGRLMIYEETPTGLTTPNTDLKGYVSRDGGTTYTQTPLTEDTIYGQAGMDQYTKLMLHCDGSNGGTTFTDSSDTPHTVTPAGNTHTDTAVKKFGTAAAQFDGTGDNLSIPDSADWEFGAGEFTIDTWVYATTTTAAAVVVQQGVVTGNDRSFWLRFKYDGTNQMCFAWSTDGTWQTKQLADPDAFPAGQWVHVAITRDSNTLRLYINGVQKNSTTEAGSLHNSTQDLYIGSDADASNSWNGYMDEIRISNTCRYPNGTTFTPPTIAYGNNQRLLSGSVDISGQPAGTNMKYKIETLNQSATKVCRLHGASLLWA